MTDKNDKAVVVPLDAAGTFALLTQPDRSRRWMTVAAGSNCAPEVTTE